MLPARLVLEAKVVLEVVRGRFCKRIAGSGSGEGFEGRFWKRLLPA